MRALLTVPQYAPARGSVLTEPSTARTRWSPNRPVEGDGVLWIRSGPPNLATWHRVIVR